MPPLGECILEPQVGILSDSNSSLRSTVTVEHLAKKRSSVSFCERVRVSKTIHVNDMSKDECKNYWITSDEFSSGIAMADAEAEFAELNHAEDSEDFSHRGLEGRSAAATEEYSEKYFQLMLSVLEEQEIQRHYGCFDAERVANLCRSRTQTCVQEALLRATQDALAAKDSLSSI